MTREEAIAYGKRVIDLGLNDETQAFCEMAIKALEQESVLDKIREEIWDLQYGDEEKSETDEDMADAYNNAIRQVIEIIDKYTAESEVTE